jgi:hypothetical protein
MRSGIFCCSIKIFDKFHLCLKTAAGMFPFSCMTFLILNDISEKAENFYSVVHSHLIHAGCLRF